MPDGRVLYEPKWDGFRTIVFRDGDEVELGSRNEKPMTRYFPEVVEAVRAALPERCVVDGEIVIADAATGSTSRRCSSASTRRPPGSRCWPARPRPRSSPSTCWRSATRTSPGSRSPSAAARWRRRWPARRAPVLPHPGDPGRRSRPALARRSSRAPASTASSPSRWTRRTSRTSARCSRSSTPGPRTAWSPGSAGTRAARSSARCCSACTTTAARCSTSASSAAFPMARRAELVDELAPLRLDDARQPPVGRPGPRRRARGRPAARGGHALERHQGPVVGAAAARAGASRWPTTTWRAPGSGTPRSCAAGATTGTPASCTYAQLEQPVRFDLAEVLGAG